MHSSQHLKGEATWVTAFLQVSAGNTLWAKQRQNFLPLYLSPPQLFTNLYLWFFTLAMISSLFLISSQFHFCMVLLFLFKKKKPQAPQWAFICFTASPVLPPTVNCYYLWVSRLPYSTCRLAEVHELVVWSVKIFGMLGCICFSMA